MRDTWPGSVTETATSTWASRVTSPFCGDWMVGTGGAVSMVNVRWASALLPAWSTAVMTSVCDPPALTVVPLVKSAPSSFAVAVPGCASSTVQEMVAGVLRCCPSATPVTVMTGATRSMVNWAVLLSVLPARSHALTTSV
ncbi:hypothetical protein COEX109129_10070 [Corallococcus exiguus]